MRCANGKFIKSPKTHVSKTQTYIRQGVGTQSPEPVEAKSPMSSMDTDRERVRRCEEGEISFFKFSIQP